MKFEPTPRTIPQGKVLLAECGEVNDSNRAQTRELAKAFSPKVHAEIVLLRSSAGFEPAGSVCRWTNGYFAVRWFAHGAIQGQRYFLNPDGETKARGHFVRLTQEA